LSRLKLLSAVLLAAFLSLAPVAGCDSTGENFREAESDRAIPPDEGPAAGKEKLKIVNLNWIGHWKGEGKREDLVHELKREYEFLHPNVKINMVFNADLEGDDPNRKAKAADAIVKMIRTGEIDWDLVFLDAATYGLVTERLGDPSWPAEHLVDFSGVPGFPESQKNFIVEDPRYRKKVGGILTGPFIENYLMNLWYNADVAERVGLDIRERDMTFSDFKGYAEALHRYNREQGTSIAFIQIGSWNRLDFLFENIFKSLFEEFDAAVEKTFNEEKGQAFLDTLTAFEDLAKYQPILPEGWEEVSALDINRKILLDDAALFIAGGTFMYNQFVTVDPEKSLKMKPVENPVMGNANGLIGDYTPIFAVMSKSGNREVAIDFLMSWAQPKVAEKWVRYTKNLTGTKGNLSEVVSDEIDTFGDTYETYVMDMERKHGGVPMMYMREPTYVLGVDSPVSVVELRAKLAEILEGSLTARDYYEDVMRRMGEASK
jgi:ABC-type glycerol-3-phosphate transport system substrate-binding protein